MSANPVELVGGLASANNVVKADLIAWAKARVAQVFADATEIRNTTLLGQRALQITSTGDRFLVDTSDATSPDDGVSCIISADGYRFKRIAPPGSLKTLQTVDTTNRSTASTTFTASGVISPSLSPSSSSNKILVDVRGLVGAAAAAGVLFKIFRSINGGAYADVTPAGPSELQGLVIPDANSAQSLSLSLLDAPATTQAVLYQVYFKVNTSTGYLGRRGVDTLFNSPTVVTVTEIKG